MGYITHANGDGYMGVTVGLWSDGWQGTVSAPSEADGKYTVDSVPPGSYWVAVVDLSTCEVRADGQAAAGKCTRLSNVISVRVSDVSECEQAGTVQWAEVHFRGP